AKDYVAKLEAGYVVLDQDHRRDMIAADLDRLAHAEGLAVKPDPGLLDEVTGLAEFPVVLMGAIDDASMTLPPEVLATAMRTHQKYFSCLKPDGSPAPRFLFVANNLTPDDSKTIVAGNERVLTARLAKADLSTGMVGEFPELQGVMGRYYALNDGEDPRVADAIADHYKPLGPNDTCPTAPDSIVVALADKLDALAAFFAIGEKPTGSRDPFALRRAAQGIIRLILENELRLSLRAAFEHAHSPSWPG